MKTRRIELYGGPGSGKSSLTAWLFARLKMQGVNVEHVQEFIKSWAFTGKTPISWDQVYVTGHQLHREDIILRSSPDIILISESPIFLGACYAKKFCCPCWEQLVVIACMFETHFPATNIFINREDMPYVPEARFENNEEAKQMDTFIKEEMGYYGIKFKEISYNDIAGLQKIVQIPKNPLDFVI